MKVIDPYVVIEAGAAGAAGDGRDTLRRIERAGRTCYKSEDRITDDSAAAFVLMLIGKGHESVLEHERVTVRFVVDRGVSHEIVRHRLASFSQESTRFCNYGKGKFGGEVTFIRPPWVSDDCKNGSGVWYTAMTSAEKCYLGLLEHGWKPEQARSVLPNSLKTEIVVSANLREWRLIFRQRTAAAAHPQMRQVMVPLRAALAGSLAPLFDDLPPAAEAPCPAQVWAHDEVRPEGVEAP